MQLKDRFEITAVFKKSKAKLFEELIPGDIIEMSLEIKCSYGYSTYITVTNTRTGNHDVKPIGILANILANFSLQEI